MPRFHPHPHLLPALTRRRAARLFASGGGGLGDDTGAATAEYAIATMAIVKRK